MLMQTFDWTIICEGIITVDYRFYIKVRKSSIQRELENQSLIAGGIMTKKLFIYSSDCILFLSLELSLQVLGDCDESCHQERLCSKSSIYYFFINKTRRYSRKRGDIAIQYKFTSFYYKQSTFIGYCWNYYPLADRNLSQSFLGLVQGQCLGLVFRIRVRIRVSFLSRPIHCKHLSLIESTTSSVTSPNNGTEIFQNIYANDRQN